MSFKTTMLRIARYSTYAVPIGVTIFIAAMLLISGTAEPATGPKQVRGYVYDSLGTPIENANVTVQIRIGESVRSTLYCDATDETGYYVVDFGPSDWDIGNTIFVNATFGGEYNTNSVIANDFPFQNLDVTLGIVIPEFGSLISLTLAIFGAASIFIIISRKRG